MFRKVRPIFKGFLKIQKEFNKKFVINKIIFLLKWLSNTINISKKLILDFL